MLSVLEISQPSFQIRQPCLEFLEPLLFAGGFLPPFGGRCRFCCRFGFLLRLQGLEPALQRLLLFGGLILSPNDRMKFFPHFQKVCVLGAAGREPRQDEQPGQGRESSEDLSCHRA